MARNSNRDRKGQWATAENAVEPAPRWRMGPQIAPHLVVWGTAGAATFTWLLSFAFGVGAPIALVAVAAFAAGALRSRKLARTGRLSPAVLGYIGGLVLLAWTWSTVWIAAGPSWWGLTIGVGLGYLAAVPWWQAHKIPNPDPNDAPAPQPEPAPQIIDGEVVRSEIEEYWDADVKASGKGLPGAALSEVQVQEHRTRATVELVRGKQTIATANAQIPLIATGLRTRAHKIIIEDHPDYDDDAIARITIVTGEPLGKVVDYTGSTYNPANGTIALGPFIDGDGWALWQLYAPNSMLSGFIAAMSRMGKSRLIDLIAHGAMMTGCTVVWYADPQGGASSPDLAEAADWTARSLESIRAMLQAVVAIVRYREAYNVVNRLEGFNPTPEMPGLLVIIDEAHMALAVPEIQAMVAEISSICRKLGIALLLSSQQADLSVFGGAGTSGAERIRNNVTMNLIFLKTQTKNAGGLIGGVTVDPVTLPKTPGYAYQALAADVSDPDAVGRNAAFRAAYLRDAGHWFRQAEPYKASLDEGSVTYAGAAYRDRHATEELDMERMRAIVAAGTRGEALVEPFDRPTLPTAPDSYGVVIDFPAWVRDHHGGASEAPTREVGPVLTESQQRILDLIRSGTSKKKELIDATGYSESGVRKIVNQLEARGLIAPMLNENGNPTGYWQLTAAVEGHHA